MTKSIGNNPHPVLKSPTKRAGKRVSFTFTEPSRTKQSFMEECDINSIMRKYEKTGVLPDLIKTNPQYGDFSESASYHEALNTVLMAETQFAALSSHVRERFQNDPQKFLEFAENPKNAEEMVKMGLATQRQETQLQPEPAKPVKAPKEPKAPSQE